LQAYDNIKDILNSTIEAFANLGSFMLINEGSLKRIVKSDICYENTKKTLIKELEEKRFRSLYDNANNIFTKLIYKWEQHEIVFLPLLSQRHAIHEECDEAMFNFIGNVVNDFDRYIMSVQSGYEQEEDRETLVPKMEVGYYRCNLISGMSS